MSSGSWQDLRRTAGLSWFSLVNLVLAFAYLALYLVMQVGVSWAAGIVGKGLRVSEADHYEWLPVLFIQAIVAVGTLAIFAKHLLNRIQKACQMIVLPEEE